MHHVLDVLVWTESWTSKYTLPYPLQERQIDAIDLSVNSCATAFFLICLACKHKHLYTLDILLLKYRNPKAKTLNSCLKELLLALRNTVSDMQVSRSPLA